MRKLFMIGLLILLLPLMGCTLADKIATEIPGSYLYKQKKAEEQAAIRREQERVEQIQRERELYRREQARIVQEALGKRNAKEKLKKEAGATLIQLIGFEGQYNALQVREFDNYTYVGESGYPFEIYWINGIGCIHGRSKWSISEGKYEGIYDNMEHARYEWKKWNDSSSPGHDIGNLHYRNGIYGRYRVYVKHGTLTDFMIIQSANNDGSPIYPEQRVIPMFVNLEKGEKGFIMNLPEDSPWAPINSNGGFFECSPWRIMPASNGMPKTPINGTCEEFKEGNSMFYECSGLESDFNQSEKCDSLYISGMDEYRTKVINIARSYMDKHWVYTSPNWNSVKSKKESEEEIALEKTNQHIEELEERDRQRKELEIRRQELEWEKQKEQERIRQQQIADAQRMQDVEEARSLGQHQSGGSDKMMIIDGASGGCNVRIQNNTVYEFEIKVGGVDHGILPTRRVALIQHVDCNGVMVEYWIRGSVTGHNTHAFYPHEKRGKTFYLNLKYK